MAETLTSVVVKHYHDRDCITQHGINTPERFQALSRHDLAQPGDLVICLEAVEDAAAVLAAFEAWREQEQGGQSVLAVWQDGICDETQAALETAGVRVWVIKKGDEA